MSTMWLYNEACRLLDTKISNKMSLEELRKKAIYQNTVDTWIAACSEKNIDWYETENYKKFIAFLNKNNLKMQKFPLCIKEAGSEFERGRDKTKFAETLSESEDPNAAAYTVKLNDATMEIIRKFQL
jgi:hypothetical protein